ncbi:unnamed protein product [Phaeothamnion confervicola]
MTEAASESPPKSSDLEKVAKRILAHGPEAEELTMRQVRAKVEDELKLKAGRLSLADLKESFKSMVIAILQKKRAREREAAGEAFLDSKVENPGGKSRKRSRPAEGGNPRAPEPPSAEDKAIAKLKDLGRAMAQGPRLYVGLKELSKREQAAELVARLRKAGAAFAGSVPTNAEIAEACRKTDLQKSLDGIDTGLILSPGKRRRTKAATIEAKIEAVGARVGGGGGRGDGSSSGGPSGGGESGEDEEEEFGG